MSESNRVYPIPRKIHQIYYGSDLSDLLKANIEQTKRLNPGWDYIFYDAPMAEDYIATHYGQAMLDAYLSLDPRYYAARSDFLRYLIIYQEGGVYFDIKSRFSGPIDDYIAGDESFILSQWQNEPGQIHAGFGLHRDVAYLPGGEYQNYHVIGGAGHPFLAATIDTVLARIAGYRPWHNVGRIGVLRVTGPIAYTDAIAPIVDKHPHKFVRYDRDVGIEFSIPDAYPPAHSSVHYATLEVPVVQMSRAGQLASRIFVEMRKMKNALSS